MIGTSKRRRMTFRKPVVDVNRWSRCAEWTLECRVEQESVIPYYAGRIFHVTEIRGCTDVVSLETIVICATNKGGTTVSRPFADDGPFSVVYFINNLGGL